VAQLAATFVKARKPLAVHFAMCVRGSLDAPTKCDYGVKDVIDSADAFLRLEIKSGSTVRAFNRTIVGRNFHN
jgi:hypothetical protein